MWNIPPIVGQKVTLDPSYGHYNDFKRTQSKGGDGYILSIEGMTLSRWFLGQRQPTTVVVWENGHVNSYEMKALLPIDSFKTTKRVEFMSGTFLQLYNERQENLVAERVIMKNDDVKHYDMFDKEKRLGVLRKAEATFQTLDEEHQNQESVQMKYMSILEEIERTKRAEEVVLFLEHELEGDDVATPKKYPSELLTSSAISSELSGRDFLNPCAEINATITPEHFSSAEQAHLYRQILNGASTRLAGYVPGELNRINGSAMWGINTSAYREQIEQLEREAQAVAITPPIDED